tara:strand:- start:53 stop:331 length:279 start_codon:yes stop_codon:yes gene_type:complete
MIRNNLLLIYYMEPNIIDYYNDYPSIINVIDKLNEETNLLQKENDKLKKNILDLSKNLDKELKEYKSMNELREILIIIQNEKNKNKNKFCCF